MLPWSVMPTAGWPSAAAAAMTSPIRAAPSSIENSVWRWRWTKESLIAFCACPQPVDNVVENDTAVVPLSAEYGGGGGGVNAPSGASPTSTPTSASRWPGSGTAPSCSTAPYGDSCSTSTTAGSGRSDDVPLPGLRGDAARSSPGGLPGLWGGALAQRQALRRSAGHAGRPPPPPASQHRALARLVGHPR